MARDIEFGDGVYVLPHSFFDGAGRDIDLDKVEVLIVYPNNATGEEVAKIVDGAARLYEESTS